MIEQKLSLEMANQVQKVADDLRSLADSIRALCGADIDGRQESNGKQPEKSSPLVPLEKVRSVLAEKSRNGFTSEVREIIRSFGAERLSEISPEKYGDVLKKAEVLGNG